MFHKAIFIAVALLLAPTQAPAQTVSPEELKSLKRQLSQSCLGGIPGAGPDYLRSARCSSAARAYRDGKRTYDRESKMLREIWSEYVKTIPGIERDGRLIMVRKGQPSITLKSYWLEGWENSDTYYLTAFELPNLEGQASGEQPHFSVWRTNAVGKNKYYVRDVESAEIKVYKELGRRVKLGHFKTNMVVLFRKVDNNPVRFGEGLNPGCNPPPRSYDEAVERGC